MTQPACSVIIPSYQSAQTIQACLVSVLAQDFQEPFEVIVVDSASDATHQIVRQGFSEVRLVHLSQRADPALARNTGAQHANSEILAFIDSDCVAATDWLRRLYETLTGNYQAAGGSVLNGNPESLVSWAGYFCEFREFLPGRPAQDVQNLTLGNAAYRARNFWEAGGFPAGFFPQEDQIFHAKFCQRGGRLRFDPRIRVSHKHRSEQRAFLDHQRRIGRANALVVQRLRLPGAAIARRRGTTRLALPGLVVLRFARTLAACRNVERGIILRKPVLTGLCLLGTAAWGEGFLEGAEAPIQPVEAAHVYPGG